MSEPKRQRQQNKKLGIAYRWTDRNWLSAVYRKSALVTATNFHRNDRRTPSHDNSLTYKEFTNNLAILFISAGAFGTGIGQLLFEITRG